ncbi:hypothetical protein A3C17_01600 [Candidatus Uhrbacteria bacterium RIFCSPHIGHO2_02_FULL_53_13]|uniref:Uncharacterized protein n=2 Tax=Candidatus Uhriibacteriota TaxID=1752732 RepID=A0A1F7TZR2_9BACT|nr:MAG: hypothetical protein A3C17_01600 [Candidatus Uhrbacteria bacterium RIFCSPHIGHO2_02_FULL_53_13]OGL89497.1 MAG: hypothetical protein A3I45_00240 [Candidatus Uhrbacteria bacterium RIFCSPLOWO2_02_FULL_53_10]
MEPHIKDFQLTAKRFVAGFLCGTLGTWASLTAGLPMALTLGSIGFTIGWQGMNLREGLGLFPAMRKPANGKDKPRATSEWGRHTAQAIGIGTMLILQCTIVVFAWGCFGTALDHMDHAMAPVNTRKALTVLAMTLPVLAPLFVFFVIWGIGATVVFLGSPLDLLSDTQVSKRIHGEKRHRDLRRRNYAQRGFVQYTLEYYGLLFNCVVYTGVKTVTAIGVAIWFYGLAVLKLYWSAVVQFLSRTLEVFVDGKTNVIASLGASIVGMLVSLAMMPAEISVYWVVAFIAITGLLYGVLSATVPTLVDGSKAVPRLRAWRKTSTVNGIMESVLLDVAEASIAVTDRWIPHELWVKRLGLHFLR